MNDKVRDWRPRTTKEVDAVAKEILMAANKDDGLHDALTARMKEIDPELDLGSVSGVMFKYEMSEAVPMDDSFAIRVWGKYRAALLESTLQYLEPCYDREDFHKFMCPKPSCCPLCGGSAEVWDDCDMENWVPSKIGVRCRRCNLMTYSDIDEAEEDPELMKLHLRDIDLIRMKAISKWDSLCRVDWIEKPWEKVKTILKELSDRWYKEYDRYLEMSDLEWVEDYVREALEAMYESNSILRLSVYSDNLFTSRDFFLDGYLGPDEDSRACLRRLHPDISDFLDKWSIDHPCDGFSMMANRGRSDMYEMNNLDDIKRFLELGEKLGPDWDPDDPDLPDFFA